MIATKKVGEANTQKTASNNFQVVNQNLYVKEEYATITERGKMFNDAPHNNNEIRIYCNLYPDIFTFQIRTYKPITQFNAKAVPKDMIASVALTIEEMEKILAFMKAIKNADGMNSKKQDAFLLKEVV